MNTQETFETIVKHLITQGIQATINGSTIDGLPSSPCAYRGFNGFKCAIGCLITDEEYDPEMENKSVNQLVCDELLPKSLQNLPISFLVDMQCLHDQFETYSLDNSSWIGVVEYYATEYTLNCDFLATMQSNA